MKASKEAIRAAQILEEAVIPGDVVSPGTRVRYVQLEDAKEREIQLLGPWDADGEERVSYRSPLATGMLGRKPGDEIDIELPSGMIKVRIDSIVPIEF